MREPNFDDPVEWLTHPDVIYRPVGVADAKHAAKSRQGHAKSLNGDAKSAQEEQLSLPFEEPGQ